MRKTKNSASSPNEGLRILVIGNSIHHTKNSLFLIRELLQLDPSIHATLVCYAAQYEIFSEFVADSTIEVISFEDGASKNNTKSQPQHFEKNLLQAGFLKKILFVKRYLVKIPVALPILKKPFEVMISIAKHSTPGLILRERLVLAQLREQKRIAERLLEQVSPNLILAFGDRHPDIEAPILLVASERRIKVVVPYVTYSGKDILAEVRKDDVDFHIRKPFSFYRWIKARYFRNQLYEELFYQPPCALSAYEKFGVTSSYPWCLGNGLSDIICVDSENTAQRYMKDRVHPDKIRIIGDVVYDKIAGILERRHEIKADIIEKYRFDANLKLIVLALPQLAEQGLMDWETHWKEINFIVKEVSKAGQNLLISLHPRMNPDEYAFLETMYSCRIAQERLYNFVSAADLFIAAFSSTVIWSVLCGIKTIIVDLYGLNYKFYDYLESVSFVREHDKVLSITKLALNTSDVQFSSDWKALSRDVVLDGHTTQRYLDLFVECANDSTTRKIIRNQLD